MLHLKLQKVKTFSPPAEKNRAKPEKQKGKKEGGWGEGIFALLRLELERFRFSLIKRKPKQKIFHLLLKEKNGGQKKIKNVMKKFLFWFAVAERRQAETHLIILDSVQKKLEFQPKGTTAKRKKKWKGNFWFCFAEAKSILSPNIGNLDIASADKK